MAKPV